MLLAITHIRFGVRVETRFALKDFAKGEAELAVAGGNDVDISVDENKARIELPEGGPGVHPRGRGRRRGYGAEHDVEIVLVGAAANHVVD